MNSLYTMIGKLFLNVLNASITASWMILAVLVIRAVFRKMPKRISLLFWAMIAIRLMIPWTFESSASLVPSPETFPVNSIYSSNSVSAGSAEHIQIHSGITVIDENSSVLVNNSSGPVFRNSLSLFGCIWLLGILVLLAYTVYSYLKLKKSLQEAVPAGSYVYDSDYADSPFIFGFLKPAVYLPSDMDPGDRDMVISHEMAHIRRRDYLIKPFGYLIAVIHWFNPLVWLSYALLQKDIELACDEAVVRDMDLEERKAYSCALLKSGMHRRTVFSYPLAFGEIGVKERIRNVLNYRKPAFWVIAAALAGCVIFGICFLSNPRNTKPVSQYARSSYVAFTDHYAVFSDGDRLYYSDYDNLNEKAYLCFDPACSHRGTDCSAYIGGENKVMIFGAGDYLYYPYLENGTYSFYRMTYRAENKEKLFDFPYYPPVSYSYPVIFNDPYVCITTENKELNEGRGSVLIRNVSDEGGEWKCIFGENESRSYIYAFYKDGWYFAAYRIADDRFGLDAYRVSDGRYVDVTDEWDRLRMDDIAVAQDRFIWTKMEDGFYTKGFDDQKPVKINSLEKGIDQAQTFADDEFFILVNTSGQIDGMFDVPEEEKGMKIYDMEGNLLVRFKAEELGFRPWYVWSEDDRIVFANSDVSYDYPYFYIYRTDIRNGKAEIHLILK